MTERYDDARHVPEVTTGCASGERPPPQQFPLKVGPLEPPTQWEEIIAHWPHLDQFVQMVWGMALGVVRSSEGEFRMYAGPGDILAALIRSARDSDAVHAAWATEHGWTPPSGEPVVPDAPGGAGREPR